MKSRNTNTPGCGCGSVARADSSNSRGQQFESRHWQKIILNILLSTVLKKTKIKKQRPVMAHLKKLNTNTLCCFIIIRVAVNICKIKWLKSG